jgi:hypothetical protein
MFRPLVCRGHYQRDSELVSTRVASVSPPEWPNVSPDSSQMIALPQIGLRLSNDLLIPTKLVSFQ